MATANTDKMPQLGCNKHTVLGILGCFGGCFIHLVIGSLYQWGIINIYITSYYRMSDPNITLEGNAIAFPIMMFSIGLTVKVGLMLAQRIHPLIILVCTTALQATVIFCSSYAPNMLVFVIIYGVLFGLISGMNFMLVIYQCDKYFPQYKMEVNGLILVGTGLGSVVFGLFSYNFLNPNKIPPQLGYYIGSQQLQSIALKVPQCLRWLSLLYLIIGSLGVIFISHICIDNYNKKRIHHEHHHLHQIKVSGNAIVPQHGKQNKQNEKKRTGQFDLQTNKKVEAQQRESNLKNLTSNQVLISTNVINEDKQQKSSSSSEQQQDKTPHPETVKQMVCSKVFWIEVGIIFFGSMGLLLVNGNYKTYVKTSISNDQFLTIIGVVGSIGNGVSRFFWNVLIHKTGYKFILIIIMTVQITLFAILRLTVTSPAGFLICVMLLNICLGGLLGTTPTVLQLIFGVRIGSSAYAIYWQVFAIGNFVQYLLVSNVVSKITFNNVIYICLGSAAIAFVIAIFANFQAPWNNSVEHLGYFSGCKKKQPNLVDQNKQKKLGDVKN